MTLRRRAMTLHPRHSAHRHWSGVYYVDFDV
jgi:hypothetical protein